jgi:hypothetical protein
MLSAPSKPKKKLLGHKLLKVEWERSNLLPLSFEVEYRERGTPGWYSWRGIYVKNGRRVSATIIGLRPATKYEIRVRGRKWLFKTSYSPVLLASTLNS